MYLYSVRAVRGGSYCAQQSRAGHRKKESKHASERHPSIHPASGSKKGKAHRVSQCAEEYATAQKQKKLYVATSQSVNPGTGICQINEDQLDFRNL